MVVVPSITAFTPFPYQASLPRHRHCSSSVKGVNKHSKTVLLATSSRDLKQQKAEEQQARKPRKKTTTTKRKTTAAKKGTKRIKMSNKMDSETAAQHEEEAKQTSLMERLQRATAKAKAAAIQAEYAAKRQQLEENGQEKQILSQQQKQQNSSSFHTNNNSDNSNQENTTDKKDPISQLGTLTQLMKIIDRELVSGRDGSKTFNVHGTTNPPPGVTQDSMRSLLEENERKLQQRHSRKSMVKHVAVIFSKSLINDMVTLEYACRLRALAKALLETEDDGEMGNEEGNGNGNGITYKPSVICFVGDRSSGNVVSDADAGYLFFRHLCQANNISLDGINMVLEEASLGKGALRFILQHLRQEYIPDWLDESSDEESATDEYGEKRQQPRKKIQLHFTFFSSDYDLCRLNDIHRRSPRQSLLTPLQANLEEDFSYPSPYASPAASPINLKGNLRSSLDGIVECSWSFCFAPYPYIHFADKVTAFLGKCYILAEELTPVLVNIRGVVDGVSLLSLLLCHWVLLIADSMCFSCCYCICIINSQSIALLFHSVC